MFRRRRDRNRSAAMDLDQPTQAQPLSVDQPSASQTDLVLQRLHMKRVPMEYIEKGQMGLVQFLKDNKAMLQEVVSALLPGLEEAQLPTSEEAKGPWHEHKQGYREGIRWAQWLMFEGEPEEKLREMQQKTGHIRGVCGAVWGMNDIAYRCRTCENDPTCAICVPCFEAGNHVNHDYSMIHTGGGCCDCGDVTAWKDSGFCSQHKGPGHVSSLSEAVLITLEPVLEAVFLEWAARLQAAEMVTERKPKRWDDQPVEERVASQTSAAMVEMLLNFCNCSESMLTFTGSLMTSDNVRLLDVLLRSECFLPKKVVGKLHELLFKLMGDPNFKYQFAKAFIRYYPHLIRNAMIEESESTPGSRSKDNSTLSSFSVQIFTVPTLTPRLVFDLRLLDMLLGSLKEVSLYCAGDDGRLMVSKGPQSINLYYRILEDIKFVMRHLDVAQYVARERPDLSKAWLHVVAYTQGMDPQRRQTNIHVEEETENWVSAFCLELQMAGIHRLNIDGAAKTNHMVWMEGKSSRRTDVYSWEEPEDDVIIGRHAKMGRSSRETDMFGHVGSSGGSIDMEVDSRGVAGASNGSQAFERTKFVSGSASNPAALLWLISECLQILDTWLLLDASWEAAKSKWPGMQKGGTILQRRGLHWRGRGGRGVTRDSHSFPLDEPIGGTADADVRSARASAIREGLRCNRRTAADCRIAQDMIGERAGRRDSDSLPWNGAELHERDGNLSLVPLEGESSGVEGNGRDEESGSADWWMGSQLPVPDASLGFIWSERDWLEIDFDVSQQEVSFHIPLHRFLALTLQKSLEVCSTSPHVDRQEACKRTWHCDYQSFGSQGFLMQLFPAGYRVPSFVSFLMEHPLRLQVCCAQVCAGMWRRNGHSLQSLCDYYRSVKWCEESSDLDLFLLQCCGVMAPSEEFVERIVSRFGLADYFSLFLLRPNEYEATLAQQMLSLLIRIVSERGFCGLTAAQSSRRDLVRRLAISDATHSQLMKSLPSRLLENKQWQDSLHSISTYCKPSGMQQGRYSLRKECWQELDLYHPRWSARELQSAEDRYLRMCKVSAVINQLPRWQTPLSPLESLARIATCGKVHDILRSVFFHAAFSEKISESRAPEGILITALHLLALGLDVCSLFAYKQDVDYSRSDVHGDSGTGFSAVSPMDDAQEPPPLLAKSTERVYIGGADGTEISSRQSLLSLLVIIMQRQGTGEAHETAAGSHHCSIGDLIKSLLGKFAQLHRGCMYEIESLAPEILHRVSNAVSDKASDSLTKEEIPYVSEAEKRKMHARERQAAIMAKMKAAQEKFAASLQSSHAGSDVDKGRPESKDQARKKSKESIVKHGHNHQDSMTVVCALCRGDSPTSFLTLVQRSRLLAIAQKGIPSWERGDKRGSAEISPLDRGVDSGTVSSDGVVHESQMRNELLNLIQMVLSGEMDQEGPIEVEALLELLRDDGSFNLFDRQSGIAITDVRMSESSSSEMGSDDLAEEETNDSDSANILFSDLDKHAKTIDKEENEKTRESHIVTVLLEYVSIVSRNHKEQQEHTENESSTALSGPQRQRSLRTSRTSTMEGLLLDTVGSDDSIGVHMSSCGHTVHQECLDRYLSSLLQRYHSRTLFEGLQIVDPDQGEFLCPVCRRLANSALPIFRRSFVSNVEKGQVAGGASGTLAYPELSISAASHELRVSNILQVPQAIALVCNAEELVWKLGFKKAVSKPLPKALKAVFDCLFSRLCGLYFPQRDSSSKSSTCRVSQGLLLWDVLRYTIISVELAVRTRKGPFSSSSENHLDALWKEAGSKNFLLPLLLRTAKARQSQNRQSVLLRVRGMQLLVGTICYGVSKDSLSEPSMPGSIAKILQLIDNGREAPDIQFWRRTADPVLAHDPFSSLLWLVYCLPLSFPSSLEPFISLVHLLYLVCITQIIAFMGNSVLVDLQLSHSAQDFVQAVITKLAGVSLFQASDEHTRTIRSGPVLVLMRRFTLPYLRRCALLQKLLFDFSSDLSLEEDVTSELSKTYDSVSLRKNGDWISNESRQAISDTFEDLKELEELEKNFSLPSLQTILEDESSQEAVVRWCRHLSKEFGPRKLSPIPRPVTATPFKLMELPTLYQDLLLRYIKECCPVCSTVPEQPALCLLCGMLCCALSRRSCCSTNRQSECYKHAMVCGGGIGVFLMIRKTNILLQRCARQASWPSPYLDAFGEEDIDMIRGKPLYLNEERYAALTAMVVSHGLDHNSLVLSHTTREMVIWG